jgi:NAD(P) transhydrogenase subunit alpha
VRVAVAAETRPGETRVALTPDVVPRVVELGATVFVEPGAGVAAGFPDDAYVEAGARCSRGAVDAADVVLAVRAPEVALARRIRPGSTLICFLPVAAEPSLVRLLKDGGVRAFAMEQVPRVSRAQSMDALTSQALIAGYRGATVATGLADRLLPATVVAGRSLPPARVLVLGTGVAGLEVIATLVRAGAWVQAYDVRPSAAEEIASLGAESLDLGVAPLEGPAAYTRTMSEDRVAQVRAALAPAVAAADVLVATAAVPGHRPPTLVTTSMLASMRAGAVCVDLNADLGGNIEGVVAGRLVRSGPVRLWGGENLPAQLPGPASALYAANVVSLLELMVVPGTGVTGARVRPDLEDEILAAAAVSR